MGWLALLEKMIENYDLALNRDVVADGRRGGRRRRAHNPHTTYGPPSMAMGRHVRGRHSTCYRYIQAISLYKANDFRLALQNISICGRERIPPSRILNLIFFVFSIRVLVSWCLHFGHFAGTSTLRSLKRALRILRSECRSVEECSFWFVISFGFLALIDGGRTNHRRKVSVLCDFHLHLLRWNGSQIELA